MLAHGHKPLSRSGVHRSKVFIPSNGPRNRGIRYIDSEGIERVRIFSVEGLPSSVWCDPWPFAPTMTSIFFFCYLKRLLHRSWLLLPGQALPPRFRVRMSLKPTFFFFFFFLSREYHVLAWMLRRPANVHKPMGLSTWETARVERRNDAAYSQIQSSDNIGIEPMLSRAHEMDIPPFLKN